MGQFDGIITAEHKTIFRDAIDALLHSDGLTLPCRFIYGGTKYVLCVNCQFNSMTGKSNNVYLSGGPVPFYHGQCPMCGGEGKIPQEATSDPIYLAVIWAYRKWLPMSVKVDSPDGMIQTICAMDRISQIKKAKEIVVDTNIEKFVRHKFMRDSEPEPAGFGSDDYIVTLWKRAG